MITMMMIFSSNSHPNQVVFGGEIFGESAVAFEQQIGLQVVHTFEVLVIQSHIMIFLWTALFNPHSYTRT